MRNIRFTLTDNMPVAAIERACDRAVDAANFLADFGDKRGWDALGNACCHIDDGDMVRGAILLEMAVRKLNDLLDEHRHDSEVGA